MKDTEETKQMSFDEIKVDREVRYRQILDILANKQMTAKEIASEMYGRGWIPTSERNFTAPRLSELTDKHQVEVVGKKICQWTGKKVAIYRKVIEE